MRRTSVLLLAAVVIASLFVAPSATALEPSCGMTVGNSVTLTADLACPGDGLIVGATGITIDLNGYSLSGSGTGAGVTSDGPYDVTIRDGTVDGFGIGVEVPSGDPASHVAINRVSLVDNSVGLDVWMGRADLSRSAIAANGTGIQAAAEASVTVTATDVDYNGTGIFLFDGGAVDVSRSSISYNSANGVAFSQADGSVFVDNDFVGNGAAALNLTMTRNNHFERNRIVANDRGAFAHGVSVVGNVFERNRFESNRIGVQLGELGDPWEGDGTQIASNTFADNGAAGLLVAFDVGSAIGVSVSGNRFTGNGFNPAGTTNSAGALIDDGMHADGVATLLSQIVVTANDASRNADYGIEAVGVTDGGKNRGRQNGNPAQCIGVSC